MFRLLEDDNVIAVRLCARFTGWEVSVQGGYLKIEIGDQGQISCPASPCCRSNSYQLKEQPLSLDRSLRLSRRCRASSKMSTTPCSNRACRSRSCRPLSLPQTRCWGVISVPCASCLLVSSVKLFRHKKNRTDRPRQMVEASVELQHSCC